MNLPQDILAKLETPTRVFRTCAHSKVSPIINRPNDLFINDLLVGKRESLEMDEFICSPASIYHDSFFESFVIPPVDTFNALEIDTQDISQQIEDLSPQSANIGAVNSKEPSEFKLEHNRLELNKKIKAGVFVKQHKPSSLKTTQSNSTPSKMYCKRKNEAIGELNTSSNTQEGPTKPANKYGKLDKAKNLNGDSELKTRVRKTSGQFSDRNQLRPRALKVSCFWKGDKSYIPSVFKLLSLQKGSKRQLMELQDFSLKGLNHAIESSEDPGAETELSDSLDRLGEENMCRIYGLTEERQLF